MRILVGPGLRPGEPRQIMRVILFGERGVEAIAATNDRSAFVSVTPPVEESQAKKTAQANADGEDSDAEEGGVRLYDSLYETALKHELPRQTVEELVRIFGYDVDFQRRVANGDNFEIFYTQDEEGAAERPELLYAALTVGGEVRRVYRYQGDDGGVEFFDEAGRSLQEVPDAQADRRRRAALGLRLPAPSDSRLLEDAHRGRLGEPDRHADHGGRQRLGDQGRMGFGLWPPGRGPACQRLRDLLQPHVALRQRRRAGRPGCARARSSAMSARPASRPGRTCTTRSSSTAASSTR